MTKPFIGAFRYRGTLKKDEYNGYIGRRYPGTEGPRRNTITPRREVLDDISKSDPHMHSSIPSTSCHVLENRTTTSSMQTSTLTRSNSHLQQERYVGYYIPIATDKFNDRKTKSKWTQGQTRKNNLTQKPKTVIEMPDVTM